MTGVSTWSSDAQTLWRLVRGLPAEGSQAQRLQSFYAPQADHYDVFRARLLHGRTDLIDALELSRGAHLVELGCGTGSSLDILAPRVEALQRVDLVDLCPALLGHAKRRAMRYSNVTVIEADASTWEPDQSVDVVLISYALTMIPEWHRVIENARAMLLPGGQIAVVDFHLPADAGRVERAFWRRWFGHDGVVLTPDHLVALRTCFPVHRCSVHRAPVPYLPGLRAHYYRFVGWRSRETVMADSQFRRLPEGFATYVHQS